MGSLANTFPIIPHEAVAGVDCFGCIVPVEQMWSCAAMSAVLWWGWCNWRLSGSSRSSSDLI
jgi:hypothetical protein